MIPINVIRWAAEECERQQSGEMSVYNMLNAWDWLNVHFADSVTVNEPMIAHLAQLIEPEKNKNGYRVVPVTFRNGAIAVRHELIPRCMANWVKGVNNGYYIPAEAYEEFEEIHPFIDGNGRLGSLLYNYSIVQLMYPVVPPRLF